MMTKSSKAKPVKRKAKPERAWGIYDGEDHSLCSFTFSREDARKCKWSGEYVQRIEIRPVNNAGNRRSA